MDPQTMAEREKSLRDQFPNAFDPRPVVVTARDSTVRSAVLANTGPLELPNFLIKPLTVAQRLLIRFCKVYLAALVLFLTAAGFTGSVVPGVVAPSFFGFWEILRAAALSALVPAIGTVIMNAAILFSKLDESQPWTLG